MRVTKVHIALIVGFVSAVIAFLTTSNIDEFLDTIRGVAYEGVAFSALLAIVLSIHESNKVKNEKASALREKNKSKHSLIKVLSLLCEAYHSGGYFHWTKHVKYADTFENNFTKFQSAKKDRKDGMALQVSDICFKKSCKQNLPVLIAHIPIAESISPEHLDAWIGITTVVSLTVSDGLDPKLILDEFEHFIQAFTNSKIDTA